MRRVVAVVGSESSCPVGGPAASAPSVTLPPDPAPETFSYTVVLDMTLDPLS